MPIMLTTDIVMTQTIGQDPAAQLLDISLAEMAELTYFPQSPQAVVSTVYNAALVTRDRSEEFPPLTAPGYVATVNAVVFTDFASPQTALRVPVFTDDAAAQAYLAIKGAPGRAAFLA